MTNLKPGCGRVGEGKELGRVKDSSEEGYGENDVAVARNRKSEQRAGLGGKNDVFAVREVQRG